MWDQGSDSGAHWTEAKMAAVPAFQIQEHAKSSKSFRARTPWACCIAVEKLCCGKYRYKVLQVSKGVLYKLQL